MRTYRETVFNQFGDSFEFKYILFAVEYRLIDKQAERPNVRRGFPLKAIL